MQNMPDRIWEKVRELEMNENFTEEDEKIPIELIKAAEYYQDHIKDLSNIFEKVFYTAKKVRIYAEFSMVVFVGIPAIISILGVVLAFFGSWRLVYK